MTPDHFIEWPCLGKPGPSFDGHVFFRSLMYGRWHRHHRVVGLLRFARESHAHVLLAVTPEESELVAPGSVSWQFSGVHFTQSMLLRPHG